MKQILFFTSCIALIAVLIQGCAQSNARSSQVQVSQEPVVQSQNSSNTQETVVQSQSSSNNQEPVVQSQSSSNNQETVVQSQSNPDMKNISRSTIKSSQRSTSSSGQTSQQSSSSSTYSSQQSSSSSSSSGYQSNTLSLNRTDLKEPHILSIKTSGQQITGKIIVNDKLVRQIRGNKVEFDLSPHLSVGENLVKINARHTPASSTVDVEMNGPGTTVSQQNSGNGVVNSNMKIVVR